MNFILQALSCTIFLNFLNCSKVMGQLCILIQSTWVGLPHSFICTHQAVQNRSLSCSPCTDIQAAPLAARRRSNLHASLSQRCPPLPLLFVSLVSFNCTLLPALFTGPVAAPVPNHSDLVCAQAVWSIHSLVAWASLCMLGLLPLHGGNVPSIGKSISILIIF